MPPTLDQAVTLMLAELGALLPAPAPALPLPNVTVVRVEEKLVGLGRRRGTESRGPLGPVALKGGRLDSEVRFQLWAGSPDDVDSAVLDLQKGLLMASDTLRAAGFLRLASSATTLAEPIPPLGAWRKTTSFEVLFEYHFVDLDGAESLIASVPITSDLEASGSPARESSVEADSMVRWDNEAASPLVVRGPRRLATLAVVAFLPPGPPPAGAVTITRTFDGAAGPPLPQPTPAAFLAAVGGPEPDQRHASLTFPSVSAFLAALAPHGAPLEMGDWNLDTIPDAYEALSLGLEPDIELPAADDRLEVRHASPALGALAVLYLRLS